MLRNLFVTSIFLFTTSALAAPIIECKFRARNDTDEDALNRFITFDINPVFDTEIDFGPYTAILSADAFELRIKVLLSNDTLSQLKIPLPNVVILPLGVTVFGQVKVSHAATDGYTSLRYECVKIF